LEKVYKMTMAEFRIREFGYVRQQQNDWAKHRLTAYNSLLAFNVDPKRIPKSAEKMLHLPLVDGDKTGVLKSEQLEKFKQAVKQYHDKKNGL